MAIQRYSGWIFVFLMVLVSGLMACSSKPLPEQNIAEPPRAASSNRSAIASPPIDLKIDFEATPGATTGTLNIRFQFFTDAANVRVVYYKPREMQLVFSEADKMRSGDSLIVWQGSSEAHVVREFTYTVPVVTDKILHGGVYASFNEAEGYPANYWERDPFYYLDTGNEILESNNAITMRHLQLKHEVQQKGFAGLDKYEIKARDRELFWDLRYPFAKPQPETLTVTAPDGAIVEYVSLPPQMYDTVPDARKMYYNNPREAIKRYQAKERKKRQIVYPKGFRRSDLPDSVAVFHDNPNWTPEERMTAYDAYTQRIKDWIRDYWSPGQNN